MANYLTELKKTGILGDHHSVDSLNQNAAVPVGDEVILKWKELSKKVVAKQESQGENLVWVIVDGFLLFWDEVSLFRDQEYYAQGSAWTDCLQRIVSMLDVKALIRIPEDVARARREARSYYTPGELSKFDISLMLMPSRGRYMA